jgi:predicted cupin superfamily sugar epimerase
MAAALGLEPHPEGGYYLETYRAAQTLQTPRGDRPSSTAILFLVTAGSVSRLHRLSSDELWVYQGGLPLELLTIAPDGEVRRRVLGDLEATVQDRGREDSPAAASPAVLLPEESFSLLPQALVPAGSWQGARLAGGPHLPPDRAWALVSCVVTPGFDFADFELGDRDALLAAYPEHAELILELT